MGKQSAPHQVRVPPDVRGSRRNDHHLHRLHCNAVVVLRRMMYQHHVIVVRVEFESRCKKQDITFQVQGINQALSSHELIEFNLYSATMSSYSRASFCTASATPGVYGNKLTHLKAIFETSFSLYKLKG
jgi:hypothetical protein